MRRMMIAAIVLLMLQVDLQVAGQELPPPSDGAVLLAVQTALRAAPDVDSRLIVVTVEDGVVLLEGFVEHLPARSLAESIAMRVRGVRGVVNNLQVRVPVLRIERELLRDVQDVLRTDEQTAPLADDVRIEAGVVILDGAVARQETQQRALELVRAVRGTVGIVNNIQVVPPEPSSDGALVHYIRRSLQADPLINADRIEIDVQNGVVSLSGVVPTLMDRNRVIARAWVDGVRALVADNLTVDPSLVGVVKHNGVPEERLRLAVLSVLQESPGWHYAEVDVLVEGRRVVLIGTTPTLLAAALLEDAAQEVPGVREVSNRIQVDPPRMLEPLEERIDAALERDAVLSPYELSSRATGGVVTLDGIVQTPGQRQRAWMIVAGVPGVIEIRTGDLAVASEGLQFGPQDDLRIEQAIEDSLYWDARVDSSNIDVIVQDGVATITGTVSSLAEARVVLEEARQSSARRIENQLDLAAG